MLEERAEMVRSAFVCNGLTTVRSRYEVPLSPCACTDCWGCALQHGVKTVCPLGGAAFFPCCSMAAAIKIFLATDVCHTVARSAVTNMLSDDRVACGNVGSL